MTCCRSGEGSRDIWRAKPSNAQQPSGEACGSCSHAGSPSVPGAAGYEAHTCAPPRPAAPWDCHNGRPSRDAAVVAPRARDARPRWVRWWLAAFGRQARWRRRSSRPRRPPAQPQSPYASCGFSLDPWDSGQLYPRKTRQGNGAARTLPLPADPTSLVALGYQNGHDLLHQSMRVPALEPIATSAFRPEPLRPVAPLATRPHVKMIQSTILRQSAGGRPARLPGQKSPRIGSIRSHKVSRMFWIAGSGSLGRTLPFGCLLRGLAICYTSMIAKPEMT